MDLRLAYFWLLILSGCLIQGIKSTSAPASSESSETTQNLLPITNNGPTLVMIPGAKNAKKFINESYFVSCQPPEGHRADWYNPRQQKIDGNAQNRIRVDTSFAVDLFLTRITSEDSGTYTCITSRSARASFNLTVLRPITFDLDYSEQSASEGSMYTMKCVASGQNPPKIYWKVDNKKPEAPKFRVTKEADLIIQNVTQQDAKRWYLCRAMDMESPVPDAKTMNITLKVKIKPRMVRGARLEHWGVLGEWANLTCAVNAEPPARFEWVFGNRTLTSNDEYLILNPLENTSILQVLVRKEARFGHYICKARNDVGQMEKNMLLHKAQKPATPVLEIDVVAHDGARIRVREFRNPSTRDPAQEEQGKKGKALPITGYVVQYKMMTRSDWKPASSWKYDEGFVIRDLQPGITYQVRAASKNQAAVGEYSHPIMVITLKNVSTPSISGDGNTDLDLDASNTVDGNETGFQLWATQHCGGPERVSTFAKYACKIINGVKAMMV